MSNQELYTQQTSLKKEPNLAISSSQVIFSRNANKMNSVNSSVQAERSLSAWAKLEQPSQIASAEWTNQNQALAERLRRNGMALKNGSLISIGDNEGREDKIRELEEKIAVGKKQMREMEMRYEKDIAILKQKLEFADLEAQEAKAKGKDSDELFKLFELNDERYQTHPIFKQQLHQLNELHNQELLVKQREIDSLLKQIKYPSQVDSDNTEIETKGIKIQSSLFNTKGRSDSLLKQAQNVKENNEQHEILQQQLKIKEDQIQKLNIQLQQLINQNQNSQLFQSQTYQLQGKMEEFKIRSERAESTVKQNQELIIRLNAENKTITNNLQQLEQLLLENRDSYYKERTLLENNINKLKEEQSSFLTTLQKDTKNNQTQIIQEYLVQSTKDKQFQEQQAKTIQELQSKITQDQQTKSVYEQQSKLIQEQQTKIIQDLKEKIIEEKNCSAIQEKQIREYIVSTESKNKIFIEKEKLIKDQAKQIEDSQLKQQQFIIERAQFISLQTQFEELQRQSLLKSQQFNECTKQLNDFQNQLEQMRVKAETSEEQLKFFTKEKSENNQREQQQQLFLSQQQSKLQQLENQWKQKFREEENRSYELEKQLKEGKNQYQQQLEQYKSQINLLNLQIQSLQNNSNNNNESINAIQEQLTYQISQFAQERQTFLQTIESLQSSISFSNVKNQQLIQLCNQLEKDQKQNEQAQQLPKQMQKNQREENMEQQERDNYWQSEMKKKELELIQLKQKLWDFEQLQQYQQDKLFESSSYSSSSGENFNDKKNRVNSEQAQSQIKQLEKEKDNLKNSLKQRELERDQLQVNFNALSNKFQNVLKSGNTTNYDSKTISQQLISSQQYQMNDNCSPMSGQQKIIANSKYAQQQLLHSSSQTLISPQQANNNNSLNEPAWANNQYLHTSQFGGNSCIAAPSSLLVHSSVLSNGNSFLQQPQNSINNSFLNNNSNNYVNQSCANNNANILNNSSNNQMIFGSVNHQSLYGMSQGQMLDIIERAYADRLQQQQQYYENKLNQDKEDKLSKELECISLNNRESKLQTENQILHRQISNLNDNHQDNKQIILSETAKLCHEKQLRPRSSTNNNNTTSNTNINFSLSNNVLNSNNSNKENNLANDLERVPILFDNKLSKDRFSNANLLLQQQIDDKNRSRSPLDVLFNDIQRENNVINNRKTKQSSNSIHNKCDVGSIIVRPKQQITSSTEQLHQSDNSAPINKRKQTNQTIQINPFGNFKNSYVNSSVSTTPTALNINTHNSNLFAVQNYHPSPSTLFNPVTRDSTPSSLSSQGLKKSYIMNSGDVSQLYSSVSTSQVGGINKRLDKNSSENNNNLSNNMNNKIGLLNRFQKQ